MNETADSLNTSYIVNCVFNAFSTYTAIMLNILTIHAIRKTLSLPKPLKILLLSLAVSDLGVGLLAQPLYIAVMIKQLQKNTENNSFYSTSIAFETLAVLYGYSSFFTIVAISVDRFLAIHLHLRYQELVTHKRVVAVVISIWVLSIFLSLIRWRIADTEIPKLKVVITIILGVCFISTTTIYCTIYVTVQRHTDHIQALQVQQVAESGEIPRADHAVARHMKTALSTFYVYVVFLVCYLPDYCTSVVLMVSVSSESQFTDHLLLYTLTLMFLNSSLNPVIYCWKMRHIRQSIIAMLLNIFPSRYWTVTTTSVICTICTRFDVTQPKMIDSFRSVINIMENKKVDDVGWEK